MPLDYKMAATCKRIRSVFDEDRDSKLHTEHLVKIIQETTPKFLVFWGLLLKQAQTGPAVVPERKETTGMHVLSCNTLQYV